MAFTEETANTPAGGGIRWYMQEGAELAIATTVDVSGYNGAVTFTGSGTISQLNGLADGEVLLFRVGAGATLAFGSTGNIVSTAGSTYPANRWYMLWNNGGTLYVMGAGAAQSDYDSFYVNVTGDTISGTLGVGTATSLVPDVTVNSVARTLRFSNSTSAANEGFQFYNADSSSGLMMIQQNGNVGIGTTAPSTILEARSAAPILTLADNRSVAANNGGNIIFNAYGVGVSSMGNAALITGSRENSSSGDYKGQLLFYTNSGAVPGALVERLSISSAGNVHSGAGYRERSRTVAMGEWTTPTFSASNFSANGSMTWTVAAGDVTTYAYTLIGKTMTVAFSLATTTVGGTPSTVLYINVPGGYTVAKTIANPVSLKDNGTAADSYALVIAATNVINIVRADGANFTASTDNTQVMGQITFEIQ